MTRPIDIHIDASVLAAFARGWRESPRLAERAMVGMILEGQLLLEREWRDRAPRGATGLYEASISARPIEISGEQAVGEVGTSQPHALHLELGTRPHMPPIQPLIDWAKVKFGVSAAEARRIGGAVAMKIKRQGTEGQFIARETFEANERPLQRIAERWGVWLADAMATQAAPSGAAPSGAAPSGAAPSGGAS